MIVASTPLRVSLFGGSTDNPEFIKKYGYGSVISFASDLRTYVTLSRDKFGYNKNDSEYIINYSKREEVPSIHQIKNEIVRLVLEYFNVPPISISLTSDVYSHGSGLASSSSYIISLIKAVTTYFRIDIKEYEVLDMALQIEQKINPHCGIQDPYGCGIGGFKRMHFFNNKPVEIEMLNTELFDLFDTFLVFTGITRNSKDVLKDITNNIDSAVPLLDIVDKAHSALSIKNYGLFFDYLKESWEVKKSTSNLITENIYVRDMDEELLANKDIIAHKLCGAGNGGFFLAFANKNNLIHSDKYVKINVSQVGVEGVKL